MSTPILTKNEWRILRNLVFEADSSDRAPEVPEALRDHPVVTLVRRYWTEKRRDILDEAAKQVAIAKPGVDPAFALQHFWLVLDKS